MPYFVVPAKAGTQKVLKGLDSHFRGNDDIDIVAEVIKPAISYR